MQTSRLHLPGVRRHMVFWIICVMAWHIFTVPASSFYQDNLDQRLSRTIDFSISSQPLRSALLEFSKQSGIQLIYVAQTQKIVISPPLKGVFSIRQALQKILNNSGLEYEFSAEYTVTIHPINNSSDDKSEQIKIADSEIFHNQNADTNNILPEIEEIILIGSRTKGRTALQTPVPVDNISERNMRATGETETGRILQSLAPSFNFSSSSISDGTDAIKPATLRGLGPDQTLVLINGKRRHTSALVHVNTSVGRGATGVDMNAISPGSIKRIEVLRDGASAQYGSDAIAGVINIILKDQHKGGNISSSYGQTFQGDGGTFVTSANYGITIGTKGHLTLSAEYRNKDYTNRAGLTGCLQYKTGGQDACAFGNSPISPDETHFKRKNFRIGDSDAEQKTVTLNMTLPLGEIADLYMFGTYSDRDNQSAGFYRRANDYRRTVIERYPDGFLPLINSKIEDYSILAGTKWALRDGWSLDASLITGGNSFQFLISNSLNASLGENSPTEADAGTLEIHQTTANIDVAKAYEYANIAFGAEWRQETYKIVAGEPASYENGGGLNYNCPGCDISPIPYAAGFQVFKGFSPDNAVNESRNNLALYTDVEVNIIPDFLMNVAARFEDYSDFGSRLNAKLATRYQLSSAFALRGSVSSGFRAPSMQQKFFNSTSTQFIEIGGISTPQERGTFRNDSPVARALEIPELKKETSINYSLGFVAKPTENLTLTADYYRIDIKDRIAITGSIPIQDAFPAVTAETGATDGQFFTNMADTKTQGIDFVANYTVPMPKGQKLTLSFAANKTETRIKKGSIISPLAGVDGMVLFSPQDRSIIEDWQPSSRINFTVDYTYNQWSLFIRNNYYGPYVVCEGACDIPSGEGQNIQKFGAKLLTDLQLSYSFDKAKVKFTLGANNLFNVYPDKNIIGQSRAGSIDGIVTSPGVFTYSRRSAPFGYNGGYYYFRIAKRF